MARYMGWDGMEKDRFDRLLAGEQAARTQERILRDVFWLFSQAFEPIYFLQIGANDAQRDDFVGYIRNHQRVQTAMVEPQAGCLEALKNLEAGNPRIRVLPVAFARHDGTAPLYRFEAQVEKAIQLDVFSSFNRALVEQKKQYFSLRSAILEEHVECCSMTTLLDRAGFPRADIVVSDIEGHDHEVVRQALESVTPPRILVFEHRWLEASVRSACYRMLDERGYGILHGSEDAFCFRLTAVDTVDR